MSEQPTVSIQGADCGSALGELLQVLQHCKYFQWTSKPLCWDEAAVSELSQSWTVSRVDLLIFCLIWRVRDKVWIVLVLVLVRPGRKQHSLQVCQFRNLQPSERECRCARMCLNYVAPAVSGTRWSVMGWQGSKNFSFLSTLWMCVGSALWSAHREHFYNGNN